MNSAPHLVVLAGGEGSRLGGPKTRIVLGGRPILIDLMDRLCWPGRTMLVTRRDEPAPRGCERFDRVIFDRISGEGPMQGVLSAAESCEDSTMCIVGVDMHRLRGEHILHLATAATARCAVIAMFGRSDKVQPLPLYLDLAVISELRSYYEQRGRSLRGLLNLTGAARIDVPDNWPADVFRGINTKEELAAVGATIDAAKPVL